MTNPSSPLSDSLNNQYLQLLESRYRIRAACCLAAWDLANQKLANVLDDVARRDQGKNQRAKSKCSVGSFEAR